MKKHFLVCSLVLVFIACNKPSVQTVPHVTFKDFNTDIVDQNGSLRATMEFTDEEGDLDSVFVIRQRMNKRGPDRRVLPYGVPFFNKQSKGEIQITLDYSYDLTLGLGALRIPGSVPPRNEPDTLQLKFYLKDKAGNYSDSTSPKQVIVIR